MSTYRSDENWPYVDQFTRPHAEREETLRRVAALHNIGLRVEKAEKDYTRISISPSVGVAWPRSALQGGMLATLVDTAARHALETTLKRDHDAVTVQLDTKYFRPVYQQRVFAEGLVVRKDQNLAHVDVAVMHEDGTVVARGWCVLRLTRRPVPERLQCAMPAIRHQCEELQGGAGI